MKRKQDDITRISNALKENEIKKTMLQNELDQVLKSEKIEQFTQLKKVKKTNENRNQDNVKQQSNITTFFK